MNNRVISTVIAAIVVLAATATFAEDYVPDECLANGSANATRLLSASLTTCTKQVNGQLFLGYATARVYSEVITEVGRALGFRIRTFTTTIQHCGFMWRFLDPTGRMPFSGRIRSSSSRNYNLPVDDVTITRNSGDDDGHNLGQQPGGEAERVDEEPEDSEVSNVGQAKFRNAATAEEVKSIVESIVESLMMRLRSADNDDADDDAPPAAAGAAGGGGLTMTLSRDASGSNSTGGVRGTQRRRPQAKQGRKRPSAAATVPLSAADARDRRGVEFANCMQQPEAALRDDLQEFAWQAAHLLVNSDAKRYGLGLTLEKVANFTECFEDATGVAAYGFLRDIARCSNIVNFWRLYFQRIHQLGPVHHSTS